MSRAAPKPIYLAEPPAVYRVRPPVVVDCSVLTAVVFDEPLRDEAERLLAGKALHAPDLIDCELANVAAKKHRLWLASGLKPDVADGLLAQALGPYLSLQLQRVGVDLHETVALATRYQLSAYDAAYLWLAAALTAPLATFDRQLGAAARQHLATLE
jgi:predicted nucleic acid-binding protein